MVSLSEDFIWPTTQHAIDRASRSELIPSTFATDLAQQENTFHPTQASPAKIACYWAEERHTQFLLTVESEDGLQQLQLPFVDRAEIIQEFDAMPDDELAFDYLSALHASCENQDRRTSIAATLTNLDTGEFTVLLSCGTHQAKHLECKPSRKIEPVKHRIEKQGRYELRFSQQLKDAQRGTRLQLWIHDAKIRRHDAEETETPLVSISCLGFTK